MNKSKKVLLGALLAGTLFAAAQPAFADFDYGWRGGEIRRDYADIAALKRRLYGSELELRRDLRNGAGPAEIAFDRRRIARDRRLLAEAYAELERDRGGWHRWSSRYEW
ncbi:MAG TPA: hypothetical protein VI231_07065 [Candidatus Binatia bacterium]|jgi:hypothetical protein